MEMAADRAGVASVPNRPHPLAGPDPVVGPHRRRPLQVGVEVAAVLALAVDQEVIAVEDRVEPPSQDPAAADRHQPGPTSGDDVEPFVGPPAAARSAELADRAPRPVRPENGEDMAAVGDPTAPRPSRFCRRCEGEQEKGRDRGDQGPAGAQASSLKLRFAGLASIAPLTETARTLKVCFPGARPL